MHITEQQQKKKQQLNSQSSWGVILSNIFILGFGRSDGLYYAFGSITSACAVVLVS